MPLSTRLGLALFLIMLALLTLFLLPDGLTRSSGQLAYVGADGNVYIMDAVSGKHSQITADATTRIEGSGRSYHRLAWSPAGQLALAAVNRRGQSAASDLFVYQPGHPALQPIGQSGAHFVIYISWSAASCGPEHCDRLAYLIEEKERITLRTVDLSRATGQNRPAGRGWPFYFSWSADGRSMLWHVGGGRLDNSQAALYRYDLASRSATELKLSPGLMLAPSYAPVGQSWLLVGETGELILGQGDERQVIDAGGSGEMAFAWSPDGRQVAYAARERVNAPSYGPIYVYELETERPRRVTGVGLQTLAFFWAPDGERLAHLHRVPVGNDEMMQWRVVNLRTGVDRGLALFNPTPQLRFIAASFNQYAQSHRFWSPDGRYLVYSVRAGDLDDTIWLVDTRSEASAPRRVAAGSLAIWSWR